MVVDHIRGTTRARLILLALLIACPMPRTQAQNPEKPAILLDDDHFNQNFDRLILPFWQEGTSNFIQGHDGIRLYTWQRQHPQAKGQILISHGYSENSLKYREFAYIFYQLGYSIACLDHRGHGQSDRLTANRFVTHVKHFTDYALDFRKFYDSLAFDPKLPIMLFSHSMGGAIAVDFIELNPVRIDGLILSSPLFEMQARGFPLGIARWTLNILRNLFGAEHFVPFQRAPTQENWNFEWSGTSSRPRFDRYKRDALEAHQALGGPSYNWAIEIVDSLPALRDPLRTKQITMPVFIAEAGQDNMVAATPMAAFCQQVPTCRLQQYASSKHEIYFERTLLAEPYLFDLFRFLETIKPVSLGPRGIIFNLDPPSPSTQPVKFK